MIEYVAEELPSLISALISVIQKYRGKKEIKHLLGVALDERFNEAVENVDNLITAYYTLIGAVSLQMVMPPFNASATTERIFANFESALQSAEHSLLSLARLISTHRDEFKEVMSIEDWMAIEVFLEASKDKNIDWRFLVSHGIVKELTRRNSHLEPRSNSIKDFKNKIAERLQSSRYIEISDSKLLMGINERFGDKKRLKKLLNCIDKWVRG